MPGRPHPEVVQNNDGSVVIQYKPTDQGVHELNLQYNDQLVDGCPFRCHVDKAGSGYVTAYGAGLGFAASGKEAEFFVAGGGSDVKIDVTGPSKTEAKREVKNGMTHVTYMPLTPGEYAINIQYKGKHIHGSPFSAKVSGEGRKRSQCSMIATSERVLGGKNIDLTGMVGQLTTPGGQNEPCYLKRSPDLMLVLAGFQPKKKGQYKVDVKQDGKTIQGSPFTIQVGEAECCQPTKVKLGGDGLTHSVANKWNKVDIDLANAGHGALAVSIEGPHRSDIETKEINKHKYELQYKPHEPGIYLLNARFGDDHIAGSPFMVNVGGEKSGRIRETISKEIADATPTGPGSKCEFQLKIPGTNPLDMEAALTSPSGKTELCEICDMDHSLYDIKFSPSEEGVHIVSLKHKGLHIAGSPFQYTVGMPPRGGPHKVEIGGPGLEKGEVGAKNEFNIYTREAGGGTLTVAVEGPSKAKMEVIDRGNGYTTVSYSVDKAGEYQIHIKYGPEQDHVPDSPAAIEVYPTCAQAKRCTVFGLVDRGLPVDRAVTFNINLNGAKGDLSAHVDQPSGEEGEVMIQEMDREVHALRFIPHENGIYYVHIKLNEAHIPGSPFPMLVGKMGADPALVLAKGDGLSTGESGKSNKFTVVTTNSGTGILNVSIDGPSKTAIMCTEVDDGYEFCYTPMAPGDYLINIKYCNITIAGCPTKAIISGKGKKSNITETSSLVVETVEKKPGQSKKKKVPTATLR